MAKKRGLGMGMDALFFDNSGDSASSQTLRISEIEPNKGQPRIDFDDEAIATLADSIRQHGLLQPLLVRPIDNGSYQIVAGERRWRACRMLGLDEVPVIIKELSDKETKQVALIENLQRENLNSIEEALGYQDLMDNYNMTQESVAKIVGKSRSGVANCLRALKLPEKAQQMLRQGYITIGHAKALAGISDEKICVELAQKCKDDMLTVRSLEKLCAKLSEEKVTTPPPPSPEKVYYKEIELALHEELGRKVKINASKKGMGTVEIEFFSKEDLSSIAKVISAIKE